MPLSRKVLRWLFAPDPQPGRQCGGCVACCTTMRIADLEPPKPRCQHCPHEAQGCAIYPTRPNTCRMFECLWLSGRIGGDDRRRPDQLGLIFTIAQGSAGLEFLRVLEAWPGAGETARARYILDRLAQQLCFVFKRWDDPQSDTPRHELRGLGRENFTIWDTPTGFRVAQKVPGVY